MTIIKKITTIILKRKKHIHSKSILSAWMDSIKFHNIPSKVVPFPFKKRKPTFLPVKFDILIYGIIIRSSELATIHLFLGWAPMSMCHFFHPSICPSIAHHISGTIHHEIIIFGACAKWWYLQDFFSFFQNFDFLGVLVGQKMTKWPKMKRFCLSHFISQEPYILWFSFMVCMCKMISSGVFFIFLKFWFSGLLGGKRVKNCPKWQKILPVALHVSGNIHHMIAICGTQV